MQRMLCIIILSSKMKELWNMSQHWVHKKSVACLAKWTVSSLSEPNPEDHLCSIKIGVGKDVPLTQWFSLLLVNESKKSQLEVLSFCLPCDGHVYKWVCGRLLVVSCPHMWRWGTWALWGYSVCSSWIALRSHCKRSQNYSYLLNASKKSQPLPTLFWACYAKG